MPESKISRLTVSMRSRRMALLVAGAVLVLAACGGSTEGLFGKALYDQSCASCHGSEGEGGSGPPVGPGSNAVTLTDLQLDAVIRVGPGAMPGFPRLTDEQVESLVEYLRELQGGG